MEGHVIGSECASRDVIAGVLSFCASLSQSAFFIIDTHQLMAPKIVHLVRHAQGIHNATNDWDILDPILTELGRKQCQALHRQTKDTFQKTADYIVCSPLRRTISTAQDSFPDLISRLTRDGSDENVWPVLEPLLQEVGSWSLSL